MQYITFQNVFQHRHLITVNDVLKYYPNFDTSLLNDWQKKGYIKKVINRYYTWACKPLTEEQLFFVANKIYPASYISLKSALRWYNFIPEGVYQQFSVSTRKTNTFETPIGIFHYKHLAPKLYFGYCPVQAQNTPFLMAEPEKAILDTFYLYAYIQDRFDVEGLRLNADEIMGHCSIEKLKYYANQIDNKRVRHLTDILIKAL